MGSRKSRKDPMILTGDFWEEKLQHQVLHTHLEMHHELTCARHYSPDALWYCMLPFAGKIAILFQQEEQLMTQYIYPRQKKHQLEHKMFLAHFDDLGYYCQERRLLPGKQHQEWRTLFWLCEWLKNHIQWSDRFFYSYLHEKIHTDPKYRNLSFAGEAEKNTSCSHGGRTTFISTEYVILSAKIL